MAKSEINLTNWTTDQELRFWTEFLGSWPHETLSADAQNYFRSLCYDAFLQRYRGHPVQKFRRAPAREDIWEEVMVWGFEKRTEHFATDLVEGGIAWAQADNPTLSATIEDCLNSIKSRLYIRVRTEFFRDWVRVELTSHGMELAVLFAGKSNSLDEPLHGDGEAKDSRTGGETLNTDPEEFRLIPQEEEDFRRIGLRIGTRWYEDDLQRPATWAGQDKIPGQADQVVFVLALSRKISAAKNLLCQTFRLRRYKDANERFTEIRQEIVRRAFQACGDDPGGGLEIAGIAGFREAGRLCEEWFFSDNRNAPFFSYVKAEPEPDGKS